MRESGESHHSKWTTSRKWPALSTLIGFSCSIPIHTKIDRRVLLLTTCGEECVEERRVSANFKFKRYFTPSLAFFSFQNNCIFLNIKRLFDAGPFWRSSIADQAASIVERDKKKKTGKKSTDPIISSFSFPIISYISSLFILPSLLAETVFVFFSLTVI